MSHPILKISDQMKQHFQGPSIDDNWYELHRKTLENLALIRLHHLTMSLVDGAWNLGQEQAKELDSLFDELKNL